MRLLLFIIALLVSQVCCKPPQWMHETAVREVSREEWQQLRNATAQQANGPPSIRFIFAQTDLRFAAAMEIVRLAGSIWSKLLFDAIPITIHVEFAALGSRVLGSTRSVSLLLPFSDLRNAVVSKTGFSAIPSDTQFTAFLPPGFSLSGSLATTKANFKSLMVGGDVDALFGIEDAFMTLSTEFKFDVDPTNGVDADSTDLLSVMVHEIGHMLGFVTAVDAVDEMLFQNTSGSIVPNVLDLYRFRDTDPLNNFDFTLASRNLDPSLGNHNYRAPGAISSEFLFSSGTRRGDGEQASHWKADELSATSTFLGIMDPTIDLGFSAGITPLDDYAFFTIGWAINPNTVPVVLTARREGNDVRIIGYLFRGNTIVCRFAGNRTFGARTTPGRVISATYGEVLCPIPAIQETTVSVSNDNGVTFSNFVIYAQ